MPIPNEIPNVTKMLRQGLGHNTASCQMPMVLMIVPITRSGVNLVADI